MLSRISNPLILILTKLRSPLLLLLQVVLLQVCITGDEKSLIFCGRSCKKIEFFSGYGLTGPSNIHGSLEGGYPNNDFKSAIEYPSGYYKDPGSYAKRSIPPFVYIDTNKSKVGEINYYIMTY